MKSLIITIISMMFSLVVFAQDITGDWNGVLEVQGMQLRIIFHVSGEDGDYTTTMDSPDQGANGLPTEKTTFDGKILEVEMPAMKLSYKGEFNGTSIKGTFSQGGMAIPLDLQRKKVEKKVELRPQDPKDYPYNVEEVVIKNKTADLNLAGTLTMPKGGLAKKIVILISGSGPQNRDEEIVAFNHRPFLVLSDHLTREGIAVLRYDDRGVGESTGDFSSATSADFATDVNAVIDYIKSRKDLKNLSLGLAGHSEGGMIAPMVAAKNKAVDFVILLAAPGIATDELMLKQTKDLGILSGESSEVLEKTYELNKSLYTYIKNNSNLEDGKFKSELKELLEKGMENFSETEMGGQSKENMVKSQLAVASSPWFRYFISYNPFENLKAIKCPVLALNGTLDVQVSANENLEGIKKALKKGKNKNYKIIPLEGMNHMLQSAKTGSVSEYKTIEETMSPKALEIISTWINNL